MGEKAFRLCFYQILVLLFCIQPVFAFEDFVCPIGFDCPVEILPKVEFLTKIYAEFHDHQVVFGDTRDPSMIYHVADENALGRQITCRDTYSRKYGRKIPDPLKIQIQQLILQAVDELRINQATSTLLLYRPEVLAKKLLQLPDEELSLDHITCFHGRADKMREGIIRYQQYRPMIEQKLKKAGLPDELKYLPFIESAYNPHAGSKASAVGLWQFIPETGRIFGLTINSTIDERKDPEKSTDAAIAFFLKWNQCFENGQCSSWPFTLTSYNYGPYGMVKAANYANYDYVYMIENYDGKRFGSDVRGYYPSFLAATHVFSSIEKHFGQNYASILPVPTGTLTIEQTYFAHEIAHQLCLDLEILKALNPQFSKEIWSHNRKIAANSQIYIPLPILDSDVDELGELSISYRVQFDPMPIIPIQSIPLRTQMNQEPIKPNAKLTPSQEKQSKGLLYFFKKLF
ncbi:MAG: lytic transglycosylase domain-containing protein [Bdellovibrionales bacterium]|nr:lytic transglycosylase domain-containing protein [Bdellovibrionales bacterium]